MRTALQAGLWMILAASPLALAKSKSEADYWRKTQLSRDFVAKFISNEKCSSSQSYLLSCREALRAGQIHAGAAVNADSALEFEDSLHRLEEVLPKDGMPVQMLRAKVINAHLGFFDAHAVLKPSALFNDGFSREEQNYVGIGVVLEPSADGIRVHEVSNGSPAKKAGLREDDLIVAVAKNGRKFTEVGLDMNKTADLIMGSEDSPLALKIRRDGVLKELPMKRAAVDIPYVTSEVRDGIGYMRIYSFEGYSVCARVIARLEQMQNVKGMILDLRGNPGGEKAMSVCVAELFLGPHVVMGTKGIGNSIPELKSVMRLDEGDWAAAPDILWEGGFVAQAKFDGPLVVLIDAGSASGAEIVAGALQDHRRAWLVGERSFGKGSVQAEEFVPGHPSLSLKWTIERFYQPLGRSNQGVGISPNFEVPRRKGPDVKLSPGLREAATVRDCIDRSQGADKNLDALIALDEPADYQKAYALAVLKCM